MKIYVLPVSKIAQPDSQAITYPAHNVDYGVEQDFHKYLSLHQDLITRNQELADWHYLPIYWTRWHLNHNYAQIGIRELQKIVDNSMYDTKKTFTVCQYDDGPIVNIYDIQIMLASRKGSIGIDIPLLSNQLKAPLFKPRKLYTASFMGRLSTHQIRENMASNLKSNKEFNVIEGNFSTYKYIQNLQSAYVALCPRGYGGSSFRFYESMQLGVLPFLIGDIDTRPFKSQINWDSCSLYASDAEEIPSIVMKYAKSELIEMGIKAKSIYKEHLSYQRWCKLALNELEYQHDISRNPISCK